MSAPSWRKPAGVLAILAWIVMWAAVVASVRVPAAWPVQALFYAVAGLVWIAPLKPVLRWMESASRE